MNQPEIEKSILEFWQKNNIFQKSLDKNSPKGEYVFYDGPPFATGTPHYGHIVASLIKDMVPRYFTMSGYRVERRWGWDCHGLPIENIVEQEHGFKHKKDILAYGVDKFNEEARSKVLKYADAWRVVIDRLGRFVDMDNSYRTMDPEFMESVWWVFKQLWDKGLVYQGFRSMHICPRCETTLSQSEVSEGYKEVEDLSVVVKFKLVDEPEKYFLAWTTTPWTLPGNVALAVGEDIDYVVVRTTKKAIDINLSGRRTAESNRIPENRNRLGINQRPAPAGDILPILRRAYYNIKNNLSRGEDVLDPVKDAIYWLIPINWQYSVYNFFVKHNICGKVFASAPAGLATLDTKTTPFRAVFGASYRSVASTSQLFVDHNSMTRERFSDKENESLEYENLILAKTIFAKWKEEGRIAGEIIKEIKGKDLIGLEYEPLFSYYPSPLRGEGRVRSGEEDKWRNAFKIYSAVFVNTDEGTGIVHIAPAFGEEDMELAKEKNLPFIQHVNMDGTLAFFKSENNQNPKSNNKTNSKIQIPKSKLDDILQELSGLEVKPKGDPQATDKKIIAYLEKSNALFAILPICHDYPHCWRCESPLLNYAASSYFVAVTKIKDQLLTAAKDISWMPAHMKEGRFGNWLENARDWSISRQRFWGSVIPIWKCTGNQEAKSMSLRAKRSNLNSALSSDEKIAAVAPQDAGFPRNDKKEFCSHVVVLGSISELEELSGKKVSDLHKHFVDNITFSCSECGGVMQRIPDVLDCWFESGAMPYAQAHYPFNDKNLHFPARFIAEGVDQTRAWFYYLHLLACALFGKSAFQNVIVNGIVLAEDGQKMSKRLSNYPDPIYMFDKYGADAVRYYLSTSPVMRAEDLNFSESGVSEVVKKVLFTLYNVLSFYKLYAHNVPSPLRGEGRPARQIGGVRSGADTRTHEASPTLTPPSLPLSARDRLLKGEGTDDHILDRWILSKLNVLIRDITAAYEAYDLNRATRPLGEFINELSTWFVRRSRDRFKSDDALDKSSALFTLHFVLLELSKLMAPVMPFAADHIYRELKNPLLSEEGAGGGVSESVHLEQWPVAGEIDEKLLSEMEKTRQIVELGLSKRAEIGIKVRQPLQSATVKADVVSEPLIQLLRDELNVKEVIFVPFSVIPCRDRSRPVPTEAGMTTRVDNLSVELDSNISPELQLEGHLREITRSINSMRKKMGLTVGDKIILSYQTDSNSLREVFSKFADELKRAVIASEIREQENQGEEALVNGEKIKWQLIKQKQ